MIQFLNVSDSTIFLFLYLFVYNCSFIIIFAIFQQIVLNSSNTIYSFKTFKFNPFFTTLLTITLLSIAGIPPFIGFFTKLFVLILLVNNDFFLFFFFFFVLLMISLYFYLQNIRFIYSSKPSVVNYSFENRNIRFSFLPSYIIVIFTFFVCFGFFFVDDFLIYFYWLFT